MRRRRRRWVGLAAAVVVAAVGFHLLRGPGSTVTASLPTVQPRAAAGDSVIIEPDQGMAAIYALLRAPRHTLDLTIYELVDPTAEAILASDAARGVRVRVLLDHRLEGQHNAPAYTYLASQGVHVVWSSSRYFATHEKAFVIDGREAVVMSLNLAAQYYATTRDVAVVDHDPRDAHAMEAVFDADIRGRPTALPAGDDLVWSPRQSAADLVALINDAHRSIALESEEMSSPPVIAALVDAARRGVSVSVAMTYQRDWLPGLDAIAAVGGTVGLLHGEAPLYIHAKLLVTDAGTPRGRAFVGSENLSDASLWHDRELGIVLVAPSLVSRLWQLIAADVSAGQRWR